MADGSTRDSGDGGLSENLVVDGETMTIVLHADEAETLRLQAEDLTGAGDFDQALELLARAQRLNPLSADVHFDRAVALHFKGEDAEAMEVLGVLTRVLVVPDALMILVHQLRGDALRDLGRLGEAVAAYEASLAMGPSPRYADHPREQRALLLARLGREGEPLRGAGGPTSEAGSDGEAMTLAVRADEAEALRLQAVALVQAEDNDGALALLERAQGLDPLSVQVRFWRATALRFRGDHAEALAALDEMERTFVVPPNLLLAANIMRGDVHHGEGRPAEALDAYDDALGLDMEDRHALHVLRRRAEILAGMGDAGEALATCEAALTISPDDAYVLGLRERLAGPASRG